MITFLNRKEVLTTFSIGEQATARNILSEHKIPYVTRTVSMSGGNSFWMGGQRASWGSIGENPDYAYQYYIYVHKKNYEEASYLLAEKLRR